MALKLKSKKPKEVESGVMEDEPELEEEEAPVVKTKIKSSGAAKAKAKVGKATPSGLLKKGKEAKKALDKERQLAKQREVDRENNVFRFYLKPDQEETITFLDGELDEDGDLENICFYEHTINTKGYPRYVCINDPAEGIECPVCATDSNPYFATVFTVLVHRAWSTKKGAQHEVSIQLFIAKSGVADKLRKKAKKYGGLAGVTFEVSRSNAEAYNVGDDFDYVQKNTIEELVEMFPDEVDDKGHTLIKVQDYEKVLNIYSEEELKGFGFGSQSTAVGAESGVSEDEVL